ncbi:MAG: Nif3-like dinuclear metal center hexameric protein [Gammaproteobacteria bacterium]|nr:Nif3-like dinuclear metal center hexameric protein [Gammaproteobacteria bacterium]
MQLEKLCKFCDDFLKVSEFDDYCPNGLQVQGSTEVNFIVCGVTASQALIDAAIEVGADTLLVHHGYFWKGESQPITGFKGARIRKLILNNINLFAYHLPLDVHPEVGNNAQLAKIMGWNIDGSFGSVGAHDIVFHGALESEMSIDVLGESIATKLDYQPLTIAASEKPVRTLAWCTGAAQSYIEEAAARGIDAFVSGEVSENTFHFAKEAGIHYIAAGHHATERYGVQALASIIATRFGVKQQYIDIPNPV